MSKIANVTANTSATRAGKRDWIGLAVIALPCFLYSMDLTVLNLAVPSLSRDLKPTSAQLLWIVDIYGFFIAGSLITMGTLGDRIGRRRLLLIGAAAFGVASVLAAFSRSSEMLIATRAMLGVAGATIAPSTLSLIRNMFLDPRERTLAIGIWTTSFSVGAAIGPPLGGLLLQYFWWGSVFLIGVPVMLLLLAVGPVLLPEFRDPKAGRLDLPSAALSLAAVLSVIYGVKRMAEHGVALAPIAAIAAGVALAIIFVRRQDALDDPPIDLALVRAPMFGSAVVLYGLSIFVTFGIFFYFAQYLQLVLGLSPLRASLWGLPISVGFIVGSLIAPWLTRRFTPVQAISGSLILAAAGFALLTQISAGSSLAVVLGGSLLLALGISPVITIANDRIMTAAPAERAGAASGISETSAELGGALGIAILGSIGTAIYREDLARAHVSAMSSGAIKEASRTLGGAVDTAAQLPASLGAELLDAARASFVHAYESAAGISTAILLALVFATFVWLRREGVR